MAERFQLFRVFDFAKGSRVYILSRSLRERGHLEPTQFRATTWLLLVAQTGASRTPSRPDRRTARPPVLREPGSR
jgi:hypothetical protein